MLRLPRPQNGNAGWSRSGLPPGGSTCTTSAPKSARKPLTCALVNVFDRSTTRRPANGPLACSWTPVSSPTPEPASK